MRESDNPRPDGLPPAIRVVRADDVERYLATDELVWFSEPVSEPPALATLGVPERHRYGVEIEDPLAGGYAETYAGIYGVRPLLLSVTGGGSAARQVPVAGLTWVGVHPDHRRRGVLSAMMRHHLEQTRAEGVAVSALHCSEPEIYGRYGYGIALTEATVTLSRGTALTAPGLEDEVARLRTRSGTLSDTGTAELLERVDRVAAASEPGVLVFESDVYRRFTTVPPEEQRDKEPMRVLVALDGDLPVGAVVFRRSHKWERGGPVARSRHETSSARRPRVWHCSGGWSTWT
ncbi:MAG: GNAT family N-acetyltransferase [Nocardioides sp.]